MICAHVAQDANINNVVVNSIANPYKINNCQEEIMEKINTEILVSALFAIGFNKVDSILYTYTLAQLSLDNQNLKLFEFKDEKLSQIFSKYVDYDGVSFVLKTGINIDTMVSYNEKKYYPLKQMLKINRKLVEYLSNLDFRKIILKKIEALSIDRVEDLELLFSDKEKEIIYKMFGIENMYRKNSNDSLKYYEDFICQETRDIETAIKTLEKYKQK